MQSNPQLANLFFCPWFAWDVCPNHSHAAVSRLTSQNMPSSMGHGWNYSSPRNGILGFDRKYGGKAGGCRPQARPRLILSSARVRSRSGDGELAQVWCWFQIPSDTCQGEDSPRLENPIAGVYPSFPSSRLVRRISSVENLGWISIETFVCNFEIRVWWAHIDALGKVPLAMLEWESSLCSC